MTSNFNWSWISSKEDTASASESINQSNSLVYEYRAAVRGALSGRDLSVSLASLSTNVNHYWRIWNNNIHPILDSLPAGARDTRWRVGKGLPSKIDALNYGVQGTTLFVFNDADEIKASGKYWNLTDERPITIAEAIEDLWDAFSNLSSTSTSTPSSVDLSALWYALGNNYEDGSVSASTSLDARSNVLESNINQLKNDLYGANEGYGPWTFGVPVSYSVAQNIDYILKLHGITAGWQGDPSTVSHGEIAAIDHEHPYTDILPMPSVSLTQGRIAPYTSLDNDIKRIRWEIERTRGSINWYTDVTDPVDAAYATLNKHISYSGSASVTSSNPHGISYIDIGIDTYLGYIANFIGMSDYTTSESPSYSSTNYITQNANLEFTIGELDAAIGNAISGFVRREEYGPYDRSGLSETDREETPIVIIHNEGEEPLVQVLDLSPDLQESFGMYTSPTTETNIDYPDSNTIRVWTNAEVIKVIALFGGSVGSGPSEGTSDHGELDGLADDDHCFSADTELLTLDGFKSYKEITEEDEALTLNLETNKLEYNKIQGKYIYDSFNELVSFKNRYGEILVTPGHTMVYENTCKPEKNPKTKYLTCTAEEAMQKSVLNIPVSGINKEGEHFKKPNIFFKLLGLIISEGHFLNPKESGYGVFLYQKTTQSKYIKNVLDSLNVPYTLKTVKTMDIFYIRSAWARENIRTWIDSKQISSKLMKLRGEQFMAFLAGMIFGDGSKRSTIKITKEEACDRLETNFDGKVRYTYHTGDKELKDKLCHLCTLNGLKAYDYFRSGEKAFEGSKGCWSINITNKQKVLFKKNSKSKVSYSGDVWCVSVPNKTLVLRRKGFVFIAGNTQYLLVSGSRAMAGNLNMAGYEVNTTSGSLKFDDSYRSSSSWTQAYIELASNASEWSTFETNYGEVSLLNAINQALGGGGSGVTSLNTLTGVLTINNTDTYIGVTPSGSNITLSLEDVPSSLLSGLTDDQLLFADGSGNIDQSSYLTFNDNNQLILANSSPSSITTSAYSLFLEGKLEVGSTAYFSGAVSFLLRAHLGDDISLYFGSSNDSQLKFDTNQTNNTLLWGLGSQSNSLLLVEKGDITTDFALAAQTNPSLFILSANATTDKTEFLQLSHNQTHALITAGDGSVAFSDEYVAASTWTDTYIPLFASIAEWSAAYTSLGSAVGSVWALINAAAQSGVSGLNDEQILFGNASGEIAQDANFYWDDTDLYATGADIYADSLRKITTTLVTADVFMETYVDSGIYSNINCSVTSGRPIINIVSANNNAESYGTKVHLEANSGGFNTSFITIKEGNYGGPGIELNSSDRLEITSLSTLDIVAYSTEIHSPIEMDDKIDMNDNPLVGLQVTEYADEQDVTAASSIATLSLNIYDIIDYNLGNQSSVTTTLTQPSAAVRSRKTIKITQGASTATTSFTWATSGAASVLWDGGTEPTWPTGTSEVFYIVFIWDGFNFYGMGTGAFS